MALENRARHSKRPGREVRFGGTPKPALGTSALPGILVSLLFLISLSAHAAGPLTAEIKPVALRARAFAPEALDVKLTWSGSGLLEGALELSFPVADEGAPRFRSHDLALTSGAKEFRLMIPSTSSGGGGFSREVIARFVTKSAVLDLGRFDFGAQRGAERNFTICVTRPKLVRAPGEFALWQSLRLERFQPDAGSFRFGGASTLPVHVDPEEMPATVLAYTAYDLVLLEGAALAQLREKQLAALSRWVLAGGSLCVIASSPLDAAQRNSLIEFLAADPRASDLEFDPEGRALVKAEGGALLARSGFGRLVVAQASPQSEAEAEAVPWKRAVTFLWKFREEQAQAAMEAARWAVAENDREPWRRANLRQQLAGIISPKNVRILPYPVMLLLLTAFVLVIGPADWLILGRFRLRRLTWIVFPLAALAFTALTVFLAGRYMGRSNHRSMLTITDLGHDGRVLRETRFEMIFPASNQEVTTEVQNALFAGDCEGNRAKLAQGSCEGVFPARYLVRQSLSQWSPQLNRLTSLEGGEDHSGLDWRKLRPAELTIRNALERVGGDQSWEIYKLHDGEFTSFRDDVSRRELVRSLCLPKTFGWLAVCSQISPNGADDFEDLALAGENDTNISATIVARREGENFHIYRHLYAP